MIDQLTDDERMLLEEYRQVKARGHGDLEVSVKGRRLVRLWKTEKKDLGKLLREAGT